MAGWNGREWRRQSHRLDGFDYGAAGWFHVTINTTEHAPRLCLVENERAVLTGYGDMVAEEWLRSADLRPYVLIDAFVVMPDHLHGVIAIDVGHPEHSPPGVFQSPSHTLGSVIRGFKGATTRIINEWREASGIPIWQRSYHDRVIDSHDQLEAVRDYIRRNPAGWSQEGRIEREW
jgi:putative transposase